MKLVHLSLKKTGVQEMETNENGGAKESLKIQEKHFGKYIWDLVFILLTNEIFCSGSISVSLGVWSCTSIQGCINY